MVERISALHERVTDPHSTLGDGVDGTPCGDTKRVATVVLREIPNLTLQQISAWTDTLPVVAAQAAQAAGVEFAPAPGRATTSTTSALLRIAPLQWWLLGGQAAALTPAQGAILELSHARTRVRISGASAAILLNRHMPLDLRPHAFPLNAVATSTLQHLSITLWHSQHGYELFIPRSFARALWDLLVETAAQFGAEIAS